ncbi:MAG: hypothetical protein HYY93_16570 [Planctomycetes bacterium]|nr:hypothetical protein [Planctomycetota bacterium]
MRTGATAIVLVCLGLRAGAWAQPVDPPTGPAVDTPEGRRAFHHLSRHYEKLAPCPDCDESVRALDSEDEATRLRAVEFVQALLVQAAADEAHWRSGNTRDHCYYPRPESMAREFRESLAHRLFHDAHGPGALGPVTWLLRHERTPKAQVDAWRVLRQVQTSEASDLIRELLSPPHPNQEVLIGAVEETAARSLREALPHVIALVTHHRSAVREAARRAAGRLGAEKIRDFRPEEALSPWLASELARIRAMVRAPIPEEAEWCRFEPGPEKDIRGRSRTPEPFSGWLLANKGGRLLIVDDVGEERRIPAGTVAVRPGTFAEEVSRFLHPAPRPDVSGPGYRWSPGFAGPNSELSMILIAAWAEGWGARTEAMALILPRLDEGKDDRELHETVRMQLGMRYLYRMFDEFSLRRDYGAAIAIGRHLSNSHFDGFLHQDVARELAGQLANRSGDFTSLTLPAPDAWAEIRTKLDRPGQIRYLADRLRLVHARYSFGFGGGTLNAPQFVEPPAELGPEPIPTGGTAVINPFTELEALALEPADLPILARLLDGDDFLPAYSGEHPRGWDPTLHRVREAIGELLNDVAGKKIYFASEYARLGPTARRERMNRLREWCQVHADLTWEEIRVEAMKEATTPWVVLDAAEALMKRGSAAGAPVLIRRWNDFPGKQGDILSRLYRMNAPESVPEARRKWVFADDPSARFWGGMILLRDSSGADATAVETLKSLLREDPEGKFRRESFDALFDTGREECRLLACGVVEAPRFACLFDEDDRRMRKMFEAGRPEALEFLLAALDDAGPSNASMYDPEAPEGHESVELEVRDCTAQTVSAWRGSAYDEWASPEVRTAKIEELKEWLKSEASRARGGR